MNRNTLYIVIGILVVALIVLGVVYYNDRQTADLSISVGQDGVSVDAK